LEFLLKESLIDGGGGMQWKNRQPLLSVGTMAKEQIKISKYYSNK